MGNLFPENIPLVTNRWVTLTESITRIPGAQGERFSKVLEHGSLTIEIYAPRKLDPQTPHTQDEVYVIIAGKGYFVNGESRHLFNFGDVLFVPAGVKHHFEDFTDDLLVWVIFYGPEGGEISNSASC